MAKKKKEVEMPDLSIEERLKALYQLQLVASKVDRIRIVRGELPLEIEELEDNVAGKLARHQKMAEDIERTELRIEQLKERTRVTLQQIEKYNEQLNGVRNNREYDMLTKELENLNLDIQLNEKYTRESYEKIETLKEQIQEVNKAKEEIESLLNTKKEELSGIIAETQQEEEELLKRSEKLMALVEPRVLKAFDRMRASTHNGMAVATIDRNACSGCHNNIPPQRALDLQARRKIIACEYCGRILVDPELAAEATDEIE